MQETHDTQQKMKVMTKLYSNGCKTEKNLQDLTVEQILGYSGITIQDIHIILELKKQTKAGKLYSYLGGAELGEKSAVRPAPGLE